MCSIGCYKLEYYEPVIFYAWEYTINRDANEINFNEYDDYLKAALETAKSEMLQWFM